ERAAIDAGGGYVREVRVATVNRDGKRPDIRRTQAVRFARAVGKYAAENIRAVNPDDLACGDRGPRGMGPREPGRQPETTNDGNRVRARRSMAAPERTAARQLCGSPRKKVELTPIECEARELPQLGRKLRWTRARRKRRAHQ